MNGNRKRRLLLAGTAAGGLSILVAAFVDAQPKERVIKVVAKRFDYTPGEIHLEKGVPVVLDLTTRDVPLGFTLPDFGVRSDIMPGLTSRVQFTPNKVGEFAFQCDIFCGSGHESMSGVITVA